LAQNQIGPRPSNLTRNGTLLSLSPSLTGGTHLSVHVIVFNLAPLIARVTSARSDSSPELIPDDPVLHLDAYPAYPAYLTPSFPSPFSPTYQYLRCRQAGEIAAEVR
jgi:hypothetical protein